MARCNMKTVAERVLDICLKNPDFIGNHNKIIFSYWSTYDKELKTPVLTITRSYQKLCETGKIPLTDEQKAARHKRQKPYKDFFCGYEPISLFAN